jgi:hypothetical protein
MSDKKQLSDDAAVGWFIIGAIIAFVIVIVIPIMLIHH